MLLRAAARGACAARAASAWPHLLRARTVAAAVGGAAAAGEGGGVRAAGVRGSTWPTALRTFASAPLPPARREQEAPPSPPPSSLPTTAVTGEGVPASAAEFAAVLDHPALVVTRDIEWGNVILGFEQANRYAVRDEGGEVVAFLYEETNSVASAVGRQLLRRRRSFTATLVSPDGRLLLRVRRPLYVLNSKTVVEDAAGAVVGEVIQEWAPLRRKYNLFLADDGGGGDDVDADGDGAGGRGPPAHRAQVLAVDAPFLAWDFTLTDEAGAPRALLDRNFTGFGKELLTDAGRYALHFGFDGRSAGGRGAAAAGAAAVVAAAHPGSAAAAAKAAEAAVAATAVPPGGALVPTAAGSQLVLARPLASLSERALALALAIAVDFDYFSRHSAGGGGLGAWPLFMPLPSPPVPPPPPVAGEGGAGGAVDAGGGGGADAGSGPAAPGAGPSAAPAAGPEEPLERDLGEDPWGQQAGGERGGFGGDEADAGEAAGWSWEYDDDGGGGDDGDGEGGMGLWDIARGFFGHDE